MTKDKQMEIDDKGELGPLGKQAEKICALEKQQQDLADQMKNEKNIMVEMLRQEKKDSFTFEGEKFYIINKAATETLGKRAAK